jgi:hypothetical protein
MNTENLFLLTKALEIGPPDLGQVQRCRAGEITFNLLRDEVN